MGKRPRGGDASDSGSQASEESEESLDLEGSSSDSEEVASVGSIPSVKPAAQKKRTTSPKAEANTKKGKSESTGSAVKLKSPVSKPTKAASSSKPQSSAPSASAPDSSVPSNAGTNIAEGGDITRGPPVTTDVAAKKLMAQYLSQQNRPYSAIQVHDNLHKRVPKATVERVLTSMSLPGAGFICKEYGKAKIYFVDQSTLPSEFTAAQLDELTTENEELKSESDEVHQEERGLKAELQQLLSEPTDEELRVQVQEARERVAQKQDRVARLSNSNGTTTGSSRAGAGPSSSSGSSGGARFSTLADAVLAHNQFRRAWQTRKGLCMEAVDLISEGMGKKVKDVMVST